jgi:uncharacterized protein YqhQ
MSNQYFSYGGQAVLEGVMMRGKNQATVAVREPDGAIAYKHFSLDAQRRDRWEGVPFVRGIVLLWDMLNLGVRALNFSASAAFGEEEQPSHYASVGTLLLSLVFAIGLFFVFPLLLAGLAGSLGASLILRELIEGVLRLGLIVGYIAAVSQIPSIQRVFAYHGAEHKTVNAYEAGVPLNVEHVRSFSLIHPRCGTSFLLVIAVLSFVVFLLFGGFPFWVRLVSRIVGVPVIAAVAYEVLRLSARHSHRGWVRKIMVPSLALQKLTTREPDDRMLNIAIEALKAVLQADGVRVPYETPVDEKTALGVSHNVA